MFGIGFLELVLIAVVALVVFGPQKLPEIMQQLGKYFLQLRRVSTEVRMSFDQAMQNAQSELDAEELKKLHATVTKVPTLDKPEHAVDCLKADNSADNSAPTKP